MAHKVLRNENKIDSRFQRGPVAIFQTPNSISLTNTVFWLLKLNLKAIQRACRTAGERQREFSNVITTKWDMLPWTVEVQSLFPALSPLLERELWWRAHTSACFKRECVMQTQCPVSVVVQTPWVIKPVKCVFTADYRAAEWCRWPARHWKRPPNSWSVRQIRIKTIYSNTTYCQNRKGELFQNI